MPEAFRLLRDDEFHCDPHILLVLLQGPQVSPDRLDLVSAVVQDPLEKAIHLSVVRVAAVDVDVIQEAHQFRLAV